MNPDLKTFLISISTSLVTAVITTIVVGKINKRQSNVDKKSQEISDRTNPTKNVLRQYEESKGVFGRMTKKTWMINPYWISWDGFVPSVRTWESFKLEEVTAEIGPDKTLNPKDIQLTLDLVKRHMERKEWMVFSEWDGTLTYRTSEPIQADEQHLFQPLTDKLIRKIKK